MGPEELKSMMEMAQQMQGAGGMEGLAAGGEPRGRLEQPGDDAEDAGPRDDGESHGHAEEHGPRRARRHEREEGHEADQGAGGADEEHEARAHAVPREADGIPAVRLLPVRRGPGLRPRAQERADRPRHSPSSFPAAVVWLQSLIVDVSFMRFIRWWSIP